MNTHLTQQIAAQHQTEIRAEAAHRARQASRAAASRRTSLRPAPAR
ncbi:MAG TPA: hypothetical protein VGM53_36195 [Streptosporangiaceae bacterium]|jgi:hypothetical protein